MMNFVVENPGRQKSKGNPESLAQLLRTPPENTFISKN
jgi:hypothetical protein